MPRTDKDRPVETVEIEKMKNRVVRCDDETWEAAAARAKREHVPLAQEIRRFLREYGGVE